MPRTTCLCIGAAQWDIVARAASPPAPGDDLPGRITRRPGGVALNLAIGLAREGVAVELVSVLGTDPDGDALLAALAAERVGTDRIRRGPWPTGSFVAIERPDGALFAAVADCSGLDRAGPALLDAIGRVHCPPLVAADGNLAPLLLDRLLALPTRLVLVPASPAKVLRLRPALARGRATFIVNRREAETLLGRAFRDSRIAAAALCAAGAHEAVVTDGANAATRSGPAGTTTLPSSPATGGTTGAGDAFAASLIAADLAGLAPAQSLAHALAAGRSHIEAAP